MKVIEDFTPGTAPSAVALGCFDGLHLGHRRVIEEARGQGLVPSVVTFDAGTKNAGLLSTPEHKLELLRGMGVEQVFILRFTEIRNETPEEFVERILLDVCRAQKISCGFNFTFGRGGKGTVSLLRELCGARGVQTVIVPEVLLDGNTVSSTRIRGLVERGCIHEAARLLGRRFSYDFPVVHGRRLGRTMGTPTLNQPFPQGFVLPKFGVYASVVYVDGMRYYGVTDVGMKPTVGSDCALSETWMPDYHGPELYGRRVLVELSDFIRPEEKFSDLEELQAHIIKDGVTARQIFERSSE